jgi:hypothetical protein
MRSATRPIRAVAASLIAIALIVVAGAHASAADPQQALTITVPPFIVFGTGNPEGRIVNYLPNIQVSDEAAELECTPGTGQFARGSHKISCVATLGETRATAEFFILVAYSDDTDVSVSAITQSQTNPLLPASFVEYGIEVRNNGSNSARRVIVSGVVPETLQGLGLDRRCTLSEARELTCTIFGLSGGKADIILLRAQLRPGFQGTFQTTMAVSLGDGQRDLEPTLNVRTITTAVEDPGFGENTVFVPLAGG